MNIKELLQKKQRADLTDLEMLSLMELSNGEILTRGEVSHRLLVTTTATVSTFNSLLLRDLVDSTKDRTVRKYQITGEGRMILKTILTR